MSNIDKQALREIAAEAVGAHERLSVMPPDDIFDISLAEGTQLDADITALNALNSAANPTTVLALLDELEAARHGKDELQQGFIANQEEAHEAIKYATELKEQLARACTGREEAFREVDEIQKSLDHTHRRRAIWRGRAEDAEAKLEAAEKRIAEQQSAIIAPGIMRCAGCGFVLTKNSINMAAGTITAGDSKTEPCPNGCGPLWPVTWKEQALQMRDDSEQWFIELQQAKNRIAELEARTVKLPEYRNSPDMHTKQFYEAIGFNQGLDVFIEALRAAGIGVKGE
ncbi:ead/Ea22-like family protein [Escherichia coli]|nr:hypothetical protein [Escherichia coli]EIH1035352.1 ead/Ea22-like family protein [Escherichia coli]